MKRIIMLYVLVIGGLLTSVAQEEKVQEKSNIVEFTPSKLLHKGQWDIKWFNNLYTQTEQTNEGSDVVTIDRQTFFTSSLEVFTGISKSRRVNVGLILQARANTYNGAGAFSALKFENNKNDSRSGLTAIAPSVKFQPIKSLNNFSLQSSLFIPLFEDVPNAPYLDKRSYIWETKLFYDKVLADGKFQFFGELNVAYNFGEDRTSANPTEVNVGERFANNSFFVPISAFFSYFPSSNITVFINGQQAFLINAGNDFEQNYTLFGLGGKYQLTKAVNLELSTGKIVRGQNFQGLGQAFNFGVRTLF